jgi:hypothetical protein
VTVLPISLQISGLFSGAEKVFSALAHSLAKTFHNAAMEPPGSLTS